MIEDLIKLLKFFNHNNLSKEAASVYKLIKESRISFGGKEIDPPVEIAKKLDAIFDSVYKATSGVLATQMLKMEGLSDLIEVGQWFYYRPSDLYYYLGDHTTEKLYIVESKNSYLQLKNGTDRRAEPTWFYKLKEEHKEYFLPIEKKYSFDGYEVHVMPLPEVYNPRYHKNLDSDIPEEILEIFEEDLDMNIELGVYRGRLLITGYEGNKNKIIIKY